MLGKKEEGGVFEGGVDASMHTMVLWLLFILVSDTQSTSIVAQEMAVKILQFRTSWIAGKGASRVKKPWKYILLWSSFIVDDVLEIELQQLTWNMS